MRVVHGAFSLFCARIVDNFFSIGVVFFVGCFVPFYVLVFAEITCYTDTIENCTQARGRRAGGVLFVCVWYEICCKILLLGIVYAIMYMRRDEILCR